MIALGGDTEEEGHEYLVDQEMDRDRLAEDVDVLSEEVIVNQFFVEVRIDVGHHEASDNADNQRDGIILNQVE